MPMTYEAKTQLAATYARNYAKRNPNESDASIAWDAENFLKSACKADWTFGTERVAAEFGDYDYNDSEAEYINTGDSYGETILVEDGEVFVTSWADWLEEKEREYAEATKKTKCGYCGEWRRTAEEWRDTECDCGHYVDGRELPTVESILPEEKFVDCGDGDYQHLFRQIETIETHETKSRQTFVFIRFEYIREQCSDFPTEFHCSIVAVNPSMSRKGNRESIRTLDMAIEDFEAYPREQRAEILIECGQFATLWQGSGDHKLGLLQRAVNQLPEINLLCGFKLDAPQNAIGSSGWDFLRGDITAGIR